MDERKKREINSLAKLFYQMKGCQVFDGYDFSIANHQEEKGCWNQAKVACVFLKNETDLFEYQLD